MASPEEESEPKPEFRRASVSFTTKFEQAAMVALRTTQLYNGAPSMLTEKELQGLHTIEQIVQKEIEKGKIPLELQRTMPNGTVESYKVFELRTL
jgi:DNA-directed RNA polymerase subunit K/omega